MDPDPSAYHALTTGVALFDRSDRVRLQVAGPDRVRFLQNLTTNDVKRLPPGQGLEAFVTSLQGKTLAFVTLLATAEQIALRADAGALELLWPHLQKYGIFDDVALADASPQTFELHLAGPAAEALLVRVGLALPATQELAHCETVIANIPVLLVREAPTGRAAFTLIGAAGARARVFDRLRTEAVLGDMATFEVARIEAGTPCYGQEVTAENLPQELGRDARAISFVKGCYLGQETVARIDALGHVNKHLKGLLFPPGPIPAPGTTLEAGGKGAGTITSAAESPGWGGPVALGFLRTAHAGAGTEVHVSIGTQTVPARVADLPILPP